MPLDETGKLERIVIPTFASQVNKEIAALGDSRITTVLDCSDQDDCAAFHVAGDIELVWGSDYVRGPKFSLFERGHISFYDIGWYLVGANLSDIAAMGARPLGLLSVVRYPKEMDDEDFRSVLEGIRDCCSSCGTKNLGGDIGSAERLILSASALGAVEPGRLLTRSQARPGQLLVVTGPTGLAGAAMRAGVSENPRTIETVAFEAAIQKWKRVSPRFDHARILSQYAPYIGACLDTSDGLLGAMEEIARRSRVGLLVNEKLVPVHPAVAELAEALSMDAFSLVFGDSVDFELLFAVDEGIFNDLLFTMQGSGLDGYVIGSVEQTGEPRMLRSDGSISSVPGTAWRH